MMEQGPYAGMDQGASDEDESGGIDLERIREMAGFVFRAARRRSKLALTTFIVVAGLGLTVAATMPRTYASQVKLLTRRSPLIRPNLQGQGPEDNPTKNIGAMILRRDNLVQLAKEANLPERFDQTRSAPLRLKDRVFGKLFGAPSTEDKLRIMVLTLESRLTVEVEKDDATVDITVEWANPEIAYDLVSRVQKNFLELRYDSDVAAINDSVAVLEEHAKTELAIVDADLENYTKIVADRTASAALRPTPTVVGPGLPLRAPGGLPTPRPQAGSSATIVDSDLAKALEEKRLQIRSAEEGQRHALDTLRGQLVQAQLTLTPMHPTVIALQQQVDAMSQPSQELVQLRSEERALMMEIAPPRAAAPVPARTGTAAESNPTPSAIPEAPPTAASWDRDGALQIAQAKLASAIQASEESLARVDAAKEELEFTRAAYKYRYSVFTPAELPSKPKKPTAQIVGVAAVFGAALLGLLLAAASDLATGLVLESWQVRRQLKLEVLGEFDRPA